MRACRFCLGLYCEPWVLSYPVIRVATSVVSSVRVSPMGSSCCFDQSEYLVLYGCASLCVSVNPESSLSFENV